MALAIRIILTGDFPNFPYSILIDNGILKGVKRCFLSQFNSFMALKTTYFGLIN